MADGQDFPETISASDVAGLLDMQVEKVIAGLDPGDLDGLSFRWLDDDEATEVSVRAAQELDDPMLNSAGPEAKIRWQRGWGEILECVRAEGVSEKSLAPQYFKLEVLRLGGRYIQAAGLEFEPRLYKAMRRILFIQYLSTAKHIIEFGCGTGANLLQLSQMFPAASLTGCDWAEPSQELVALIAKSKDANMTGIRFDMQTLDGAQHIEIDEETAVLTLHSMEQLGENAEPFLDYLIAGRPQIALHLEPVIELYDEAVPFDGLAAAYTRKRNYLSGFLTALRQRQADGKVEIIKTHRSGFGSTYHEPYTIVVWKIVT